MGFDGYKDLLGKELPAHVTAKSFVAGTEPDQIAKNHGTLCAEVVDAMAPDAELFLAHYNGRTSNRPPAVDWLISQGVQVISHSVGAEVAPMDGTGSDARFVDTIAAKNILWVNSAGNGAGGHYRTKVDPATNQWITFADNSSSLKVTFSAQVKATQLDLRWDDWSGNATQDLDLLFDDEKGTLVAHSSDAQNGVQGDRPYEFFELKSLPARTYLIKVLAKRLTRPVVLDLYALNGTFANSTPGYSLGTPADARGALSVGAIYWRDNSLEDYSSRGPTADGRLKPELVAPARVTTSQRSFSGTSAAAPHVAGAAALVWSRFPQMSATDVKTYLQANAIDMGPKGSDMEYGYGRLQLPAPSVPSVSVPTASPTFFATATVAPTALPTALPSATMLAPTTTPIATTVAILPSPSAPTIAPTPPAAPRPPDSPRSDTMTVLIAFLGLLMCGGVLGTVGGVTMLVWITRKRQTAAPPPPLPMPRLRTPQPPIALRPPMPPVAPQTRALGLIGTTGQRVAVQIGKSVIGRLPQCTICLDQPEVSRLHAEIGWDGVRASITDLGSLNGTFVDERRLVPNVPESLHPGDRVSFGGVALWQVMIG